MNNNREKLYKNGYVLIPREELIGVEIFLDKINNLNNNADLFEFQKKQKGTATLKHKVLYKEDFFVDFLFDSGLMKLVELYVGHNLFLTNLKHYLSRGKAPSLKWHRDSYFKKGSPVGLMPAPYKIIVYSSNTDKNNAATEVIEGTHRIDLLNPWVDLLMPILFRNRHSVVNARSGDVLLFQANILHNRIAAKNNSFRSATIYGMVSSPLFQKDYYKGDNSKVIDRYNRLSEMEPSQ
jgi:ectoine hydroxylase-related dioxygenase (phytanoyl-CoA dioxygenase family)